MSKGYRSSEFWLSLAALLISALLAADVIPTDGIWSKVIAAVSSVLVALGYQVSRTLLKKQG